RLPEGYTRSVPISATDYETAPAPLAPTVLMAISARTLLPVARRLRLMVLAMEEAHHVTTSPRDKFSNSTQHNEADSNSLSVADRDSDDSQSATTQSVCPTSCPTCSGSIT